MNAQPAKLTYTAIPSDERKPYWNVFIGPYPVALDCEKADATFIAGAFNVYHETGLTPRQLADQRAELLEALHTMIANSCAAAEVMPDGTHRVDATKREWDSHVLATEKARAAIQRATGEQP